MIRISQIDDKLSIYKDNVVVLLGVSSETKNIINILKYHDINIKYLCHENDSTNNWLKEIEVISFNQLYQISKEIKKGIVVQVSSSKISNNIIKELHNIGINYIISYNECFEVFNLINKLKMLNDNQHMLPSYEPLSIDMRKINKKTNSFDYLYKNIHLDEYLFVCSIPKTGDNTLISTFKLNEIPYFFALHTPEVLDKKLISNLKQKVKVILGVRDPISQNVSFLYHSIAQLSTTSSAYHLKENYNSFFNNGGDAQYLFNLAYDNEDEEGGSIVDREASCDYIKKFLQRFSENIVDVFNHHFDKEKGFTIIKEDNLEVFIYQIEKLNDLVVELSDWVGGNPFNKWIMANEASNKWISNSYKEAQKKIEFSKEYFDKSYSDIWIKHFYSDEDIDKFKEKWKPHIKQEGAIDIKISVVIPIYNVENYLVNCLESIINQTLTEIEIICINDGSTDKSLSILEDYVKKDRRIILINQENLGAGKSRNIGLDNAKGTYIHFMDSDDYLELDAYENLYNTAIKFNADMVKGKSNSFDDKTQKNIENLLYNLTKLSYDCFNRVLSFYTSPEILLNTSIVPWNGIYKREYLNNNKINFNSLKCVNDHTFYYEVIINSNKLVIIDNILINHRVNCDNSLVTQRAKNFYCEFISFRMTQKLSEKIDMNFQNMLLMVEIQDILFWFNKLKNDLCYGELISLQTREFFISIGYNLEIETGKIFRLE